MARTTRKQPVAKLRKPPADRLSINVGWQGNDGVYQLDLRSERRIREAFPEAKVLPGMLLRSPRDQDPEELHRPSWERIAQILTGLTDEQVAQLGGVRFFDPVSEEVLWEWHPAATDGRP